jgi:TrmH family RNA methyltransferase
MILSKNKLREISALKQRKSREEQQCFIIEGEKLAEETLQSRWPIELICALPEWIASNHNLLNPDHEVYEITEEQLHKMSNLSTPNKVLIVAKQRRKNEEFPQNDLSLYLDDIQDPGNMGTIIRLADWFGIRLITCSPGTVDFYNPKVIQSTMGAFLRVAVHYTEPENWFKQAHKTGLPIMGTFLNGSNIYEETLPKKGIIVMGNESKGISDKVASFVGHRLKIPSYPPDRQGSESLNVAIAAAIVCAEFRRQAI